MWGWLKATARAVGVGGKWAYEHRDEIAKAVEVGATLTGHADVAKKAGTIDQALSGRPAPVAVTPAPVQAMPDPPTPVIPTPAVDPDVAYRARVEVLYKDILNRSRSAITPAEMDEAIDLLRVGREDELINDLKKRAA